MKPALSSEFTKLYTRSRCTNDEMRRASPNPLVKGNNKFFPVKIACLSYLKKKFLKLFTPTRSAKKSVLILAMLGVLGSFFVLSQNRVDEPIDRLSQHCDSLFVRTPFGLQSSNLLGCKTAVALVKVVCLPLCGEQPFHVDVPSSGEVDDKILPLQIPQCKILDRSTSDAILVVFRLTRVFNGHHLYHVLNNFVVNLDPSMLDDYVFHCWDCEVEFSEFFDKVLNINSRLVSTGCYEKFIFVGENYVSYNVSRDDTEKARRWREWAQIFQTIWCPEKIVPVDDMYFTLLDRSGAQNGRNMNHCRLANHSRTRYIQPTLNNVKESSEIFCNTRLLVSAEGNGLTNMLLMPHNSVLVVIWQENRPTIALKVIYGNVAKLLGMTMIAIPVQSDEKYNANCSDHLNELFDALI